MDNFVEIAIILSVIWSVISSIREKNKKKQQSNMAESNTVQEPELEFLTDLTKLFQASVESPQKSLAHEKQEFVEPVKQSKTSKLPQKKSKRMEFHKHISSRKSTNSRLAAVKIDEFSYPEQDKDLTSVIYSSESIEDQLSRQQHSPLAKLDASTLSNTILLNEILNKPLALRNR